MLYELNKQDIVYHVNFKYRQVPFLTPQTEAQIDWSRMGSVQFVSQHNYARKFKVKVIKLGGEEKHGQRRKLFYLVNICLTILTVK